MPDDMRYGLAPLTIYPDWLTVRFSVQVWGSFQMSVQTSFSVSYICDMRKRTYHIWRTWGGNRTPMIPFQRWHTLPEPALRELIDTAIYGITYGVGAGTMLADAIQPFLDLEATSKASPYHRLRATINTIGRSLAAISQDVLNGEYPLMIEALADLVVNAWVLNEPGLIEGVLEVLSPYTRMAVLETAESAMHKNPFKIQ